MGRKSLVEVQVDEEPTCQACWGMPRVRTGRADAGGIAA
jgi:hypothetical protein